MIFSCWARKHLWFLFAALSCGPVCFAQSQFLEVAYTPYDHQMERIQQVLSTPSGHAINGLSFTVVNGWMIELRAMPYCCTRLCSDGIGGKHRGLKLPPAICCRIRSQHYHAATPRQPAQRLEWDCVQGRRDQHDIRGS